MLSQAQKRKLDETKGKFEEVETLNFNDVSNAGLVIPTKKHERGPKEVLDESASNFDDDPDKMSRYRAYVAGKMGVDLPTAIMPTAGMTDYQKRIEQQDFEAEWMKIKNEVEELSKKKDSYRDLNEAIGRTDENSMTATSAAKAGKFGKLTRRVELWIP